MIFVTVGTQLPFDRLIKAVDGWAGNNPTVEVFAQIGPGEFRPPHIKHVPFLKPDQADRCFRTATLVVSHAGMGSIITSLKYRKPLLILPRQASLGEHRNDHQIATARWLGTRSGINVAWSEEDVPKFLDGQFQLSEVGAISDSADPQFISRLRQAIFHSP
jgi:UDP-N-acetylglucosamine transferase subunit ALG13